MPSTVADFVSRLNAERSALKEFVTLLETEQQALIGGDAEQLLALSEKKTQAVQELSGMAQSRKNDLQAFGVQIGDGAVMKWLRANAAGSLSAWQDIQKLAEQLQYLNRTNGVLIQSRLRHNQQALTVLHNAANSAHGLYGADGQPRIPSSGRILGSV
jgi:flagella synthesis protein FlgN